MSLFPSDLTERARNVVDLCRQRRLTICTAESCTGGLLSGVVTEIPGSSDVLERGFVTYSNEAKREILGVTPALLEEFGAVSPEVAEAMAAGALARSRAILTIAITGIAGPGGGSPQKPVGLVYIALARRGGRLFAERRLFENMDRTAVRLASLRRGLELIEAQAEEDSGMATGGP